MCTFACIDVTQCIQPSVFEAIPIFMLSPFFRFEDLDSSNSKRDTILDAEYFCGHHELMLRTDLRNLHVYLCTPEVLLLFSDNFDYQVC